MFSYEDYRNIIQLIKMSGKAENFYTAKNKNKFIIMRHDVEFSMERAYQLALVEAKENFHSTYFFQLTNNAYNLLSNHNLTLINEIADLGHCIGLHFHPNGLTDLTLIYTELEKQINILNQMLPITINIFSIHRPSQDILRANLKLPSLINAYQDDYFAFVQDMKTEMPTICYLSDSRHRWNYNLVPSESLFKTYDKIQILTHPYSWTPHGLDNLNNFRSLVTENSMAFMQTINNECTHFKEVKDAL